MKKEKYTMPAKGFLFTSRAKAAKKHLYYQAVYNVVLRLAPKFVELPQYKNDTKLMQIRLHSGRATFITQLMGSGVSLGVSMKADRHSPSSVRVHLRYAQLTLDDVRSAMEKADGTVSAREARDLKTKQLRSLAKTVSDELTKLSMLFWMRPTASKSS
jgi:hypothetical protein